MFDGLLFAFSFLTTIPLDRWTRGKRWESPGTMYAYFPLVGLTIGILVSGAAAISLLLAFPKDVSVFIALVTWIALIGGLHLDGLADACDGLLATVSAERRLEIMSDPRAGSWAVIGVVLVLIGKWAALRNLPPAALLIPPIMGRWSMVLAVAAFPNVKATGLAAQFRVGFGRSQVWIASLTTIVLVAALSLWLGASIVVVLAIAPIAVWLIGGWASRRLGGGLTGDVYGALCEVVELLCLIYFTTIL